MSAVPFDLKNQKAVVKPARPSATTVKPMTDPAVKATWRPSFKLPRVQATVVRTFAFVATSIPAQPASALSAAPTTKIAATRGPSDSPTTGYLQKRKKRMAAILMTKLPILEYSSRRNAMAPERI